MSQEGRRALPGGVGLVARKEGRWPKYLSGEWARLDPGALGGPRPQREDSTAAKLALIYFDSMLDIRGRVPYSTSIDGMQPETNEETPMTTNSFYGTIEYFRRTTAIVTLLDADGDWSGSSLVQCRSGRREDLYEAGYNAASVSAISKGGRLDRFRAI